MLPEAKDLTEILSAGQAAPSADNSQPWFFEVSENAIYLHHDLENTHANHLYNIDFFADYVSLGGVIENIFQSALSLGYETNVTFETGQKNNVAAKITFEKAAEVKPSTLIDAVHGRRTNRRTHFSKPLPRERMQTSEDTAQKHNLKLYWITDPNQIRDFARAIATHDAILWEDKALRENLVRMLRIENKYHPDGLPLESLELGVKKYFFPPAIKIGNLINFMWEAMSFGSRDHTRRLIRKSAALGFLIAPEKEHSPQAYIEGGRAFQNIWLNLSRNNVALQPMFGALALILNKRLNRGGLKPGHEKIRDEISDFFHKQFPELESSVPISFFRAGYADKPSATSGRRKIEEVIKK